MPFVKPAPPEILQEALASNDRLSKYAETFYTEEIDPGMAATLSLNDIRALLPLAPVGDCLRLRALFQSLPAMMRSVPDPRKNPGWTFAADYLSTGALEGNMAEKHFRQSDQLCLVASLILIPTINDGILKAPKCDPAACNALVYVDFCLWLFTAFAFLSTIICFLQLGVSDMVKMAHEWPQHLLENWSYFMQPVNTLTAGLTSMCAALSTRVYLNYDRERGVLCICVFAAFFAFFWLGFAGFRMRLHKLPWTFSAFFLLVASQFGHNLPKALPPEAYVEGAPLPARGAPHARTSGSAGSRVVA